MVAAKLAHSVQATSPVWQALKQIEIEVGPSVELASVVLDKMRQLDDAVESKVDSLTTACGRKIHRLLEEQGQRFGAGAV